MKNLKLFVPSVLVILGVLFVFNIGTVGAQGVNDFIINDFSATYNLTNTDPQGKLEISELINLDYSGNNHGIKRAIPTKYQGKSLGVKVSSVQLDGQDEQYTTYNSNENLVIKIGNPNKTITGVHTYRINYSVVNVINFYGDYDELYWDINGDQWAQRFLTVKVNITSPAEIETSKVPKCYSGSYGLTGQDCQISIDGDAILATAQNLYSSETLSVVIAYKKGYFTPETFFERYRKVLLALPLIIFQLGVVGVAYKKWDKYGRDNKKRGVTAPYFGRPRNLSVMQASYIQNNMLSPRHISASIIDLAIRGYLKVTEDKSGRGIKHILSIVKLPDSKLTEDEKILFTKLFDAQIVGEQKKLEDLKNKLSSSVKQLSGIIDKELLAQAYYDISPKNTFKKFGGRLFFLGFIGLVMGYVARFFVGWLPLLTGGGSFVAIIIFGSLMTKRSQSGDTLVEHMDGLKLYLGFSEKERLAATQAVDAPLASNAGVPIKDVKFFEKLLPFAIANKVEKTWAKAFSNIYTEPPDWYNGTWDTFSTIYLINSLSKTATVASNSFTPPSSSSGSGFSGGGFSGGGGGGGGGGGW